MESQAASDHGTPKTSNDSAHAGFVPPRHWVGVEELNPSYWANAAEQEKRGQEFYDKPIETLAAIEKMDSQGIARRDFLTIMGASMAMASFSCARRPVHKIIPYVNKPEQLTVGLPTWYASTDPETGYGLLVKTREGRPIKLEGNPDHPVNLGALHARGQARLLDLYDPDRLTTPKMRSGGAVKDLTWAEADSAIQGKFKVLGAAGRVRVLTGAMLSDSTRRLIQEFLAGFAVTGSAHVEFEPVADSDVIAGQERSYGEAVYPTYKFANADYVVSIGSDFLGADSMSVEYSRDWLEKRKLSTPDKFSKMVCFESGFTVTGANADERMPIRPGDEIKIAMAIAYELFTAQKVGNPAGDLGALRGYSATAVANDIGLVGGAAAIQSVAQRLAANRGRSLVIGGGLSTRTSDAVALQVAINLINSALGNDGVTVDGSTAPVMRRPADYAVGMKKLVTDMAAGQVDVVIVCGANPAYSLPESVGFKSAFEKVGLRIVISDREDETAALAEFVLPEHHFLENWGDAQARRGVYSIQQPVIAPIHATRAFEDNLLTWIKGGPIAANGLAARIANGPADANTWHDYLMANWRETMFPQSGSIAGFEAFWEGVLRTGVLDLNAVRGQKAGRTVASRAFRSAAASALPAFKAGPAAGEVRLSLYPTVAMHDGRQANNAWLQEMPDPISSNTWDNFLNVGPELGKRLGVNTHDVVELTVGDKKVELPVYIQPGMHPQSVSAAIGYGRTLAGKVGNGCGWDVTPLVGFDGTQMIYAGQPVTIRKTGKFFKLALTQWHTLTQNRPIINDITLEEYKKDPHHANHTDPHLRLEEVPTMWPKHEYKGYRWGMAIDLSSCTGCGACVIACQAENNIPVVGRNNVRVSRQMHWIRIDRYYAGPAESPDVVFQPMLCQHCENAPCETVCPVLATVHNDEGLNEQVYNRCVGTRYCQNNCPYKVRRFNFFDHWKSYEGTMNMVWNPEVTVRTRGIMEKCTFCVQRIRDAKDAAKDRGEKVADGSLRTACQQTCPTDGIVFGDINDPTSKVSILRNDPRAFRVLEVLNTRPAISYLTKVRNKPTAAHGGEHRGEHGVEAGAPDGAAEQTVHGAEGGHA